MSDLSAGERTTIAPLTGIRGIAAIWVVLHHMMGRWAFSEADYGALSRIIDRGWLGVDLFFILSGFVISYVHRDDFKVRITIPGLYKFLILRIARIYPVHLVMTLAFIPVVVVSTYVLKHDVEGAFSISKFIYSLTLTNGWGFGNSIGWNGPSWSVSSEWFVYMCFPLLALVFSRYRGNTASFMIIGGMFLIGILLSHYLVDGRKYMLPWSWTLFRVFSAFVIGCALRNIFDRLKASYYWDFVGLCAILISITFCVTNPSHYYDFILIGCFAILILSLSRSTGPLAAAFGSKLLCYLGTISYSIYMVHWLFILMLSRLNRGFSEGTPIYELGTQIMVATIFLALVFVSAHFLCFIVETPMRRWIKNKYV